MLCDRAYDCPASGVGDKQQTAAMNVVHDHILRLCSRCHADYLLVRLYLSSSSSLSSSLRLAVYAFQPGQKRVCQCQKRAMRDFGSLSYLRRILHCAHGYSFSIVLLLLYRFKCVYCRHEGCGQMCSTIQSSSSCIWLMCRFRWLMYPRIMASSVTRVPS